MSECKLLWKAVGSTDIGGGKENQDDFFVWENPSRGLMVTGVLDGHGRDVGKTAAVVGRDYLQNFCENNQNLLELNPYDFLVQGIVEAHQAIKEGFVKTLTERGFEVKEASEGYLVKRKKGKKSNWVCVHGGTSCSLVAIVDTILYTANVGDSTGIMSTSHPVVSDSMLQFVGDSGDPERRESLMGKGLGELSNTMVITSDHSPECPVEFNRMRAFRASDTDPKQPALLVVYDASQQDKSRCPAVFELDQHNQPVVTSRGSYYKNVRREFASLVAAPPSAKFQDALAFTRSIGDFHLHIYGVCEKPEVHCVDLKPIIASLAAAGVYTSSKSEATSSTGKTLPVLSPSSSPVVKAKAAVQSRLGASPKRVIPMDDKSSSTTVDPSLFPSLCVILASDGIWDNWEYADVSNFVMNPTNAVRSASGGKSGGKNSSCGVELAAQTSISLIKSNAAHAKRNFGDQADNATGVVLFIQPAQIPLV